MKITEYLKKTSIKKNNNFGNNKGKKFYHQSNSNNSRQESLQKDVQKNIINNIKENNGLLLDDEIKLCEKELEITFRHPTIIDVLDDDGNVLTISVTNLTSKNKPIYINGRKIEVEYIGKINGRKQY